MKVVEAAVEEFEVGDGPWVVVVVAVEESKVGNGPQVVLAAQALPQVSLEQMAATHAE